jgi:hypothetical protein
MKRTVLSLVFLTGLGIIAPAYAQSSTNQQPTRVSLSDYSTSSAASAEASASEEPRESQAAPEFGPRPEYAPREVEAEIPETEEAADEESWHLLPQDGAIRVYGWVDAGVTANSGNPVSRYNGPVSFNDRNELQMNQLYAVIEKPLSEEEGRWNFAGRVDLLFGSDYIFTQAAGLELRDDYSPKWNSGPLYGLAMPQLYGEMAYDKLNIRLGHFYTIIGYEVVTAPDNFFTSHAYTMQYGEPFTHTGGRASYAMTDELSFTGGLVNGWDKWNAVTNRAAFLGGVNYTPDHELYTVAFSLITGEEDGALPPILGNRTVYSLVVSLNLTEKLQYVIENDNGWQANGLGTDETTRWYGLNQYLFYTLNDNWKAGVRGEWFKDVDGTRVTGVRATNPYKGGSAGDFYGISLGLNWTRLSNVTVRPEVRWDWFNGEGTMPYDDNTKNSQFLANCDFIVTW